MQDKQKVTLYLPNDLHRQLKIQSAVDGEAMSALAQRAIDFYLSHSEVVNSFRTHGQTHRLHSCPSCSASVTVRANELVAVKSHACLHETALARDEVLDVVLAPVKSSDEGELVPC